MRRKLPSSVTKRVMELFEIKAKLTLNSTAVKQQNPSSLLATKINKK